MRGTIPPERELLLGWWLRSLGGDSGGLSGSKVRAVRDLWRWRLSEDDFGFGMVGWVGGIERIWNDDEGEGESEGEGEWWEEVDLLIGDRGRTGRKKWCVVGRLFRLLVA